MNKKVLISLIFVILWMGVIYYFSAMESVESQGKSEGIVKEVICEIDKITKASPEIVTRHQSKEFLDRANYYFRRSSHAFEYFILCILTINLFLQLHKYSFPQCGWLSIMGCFLYACFDEYHQTFVNGRTGQFFDTLLDGFGAILGFLVFSIIYKMVIKKS